MAFREVVLTEEEQKSGGGRKFKKFDAIGDKHIGLLVKIESQTKTFRAEEGPKTFDVYTFWNRTDGEFEVTPPTDLDKKLKKARRPESEGGYGLTPGAGHLVLMAFNSTLPIEGRTDPMKIFALRVDTAPEAKILAGVPDSVLHAKKAGGTYGGGAEDDIPF